jgi:hypothetical protein
MAARRSAGRASNPVNTARTPAAESAQSNRPSPVPHRAGSPYPAFPQQEALWTGPPEVLARQTGLPRPGLPTTAGMASALQETTDPGTNGPGASCPGASDPGPADSGTTDLPSAHRGTTDLGRNAPGTTGPATTSLAAAHPGSTGPGPTGPGTTDPAAAHPPAVSPGPWWRARVTSARMALPRTALSQTGLLRAVASGPGHRSPARCPLEAGQRLPRMAPYQMAATTVC